VGRHASQAILFVVVLFVLSQGLDLWRIAGDESSGAIAVAFDERRSGVEVEAEGRIEAVLPDDREGSRHQRFLVSVGRGHTVLIAHNIDLAPRVPLRKGDGITFHGVYEWNEKGGVVHWTHHDPDGRREGGWIEHEGRMYR